MNDEAKREPVVASYAARITIRGGGPAPTITDLEAAVEKAVQDLGGVSRANRPLTTVNCEASRTDR
jgi:hypothetical protein